MYSLFIQPLYDGDLSTRATFFCAQGGRCREVLRPSPLSQDLEDPPLFEGSDPPLSYATHACLAADSSQPQPRHQSLLRNFQGAC